MHGCLYIDFGEDTEAVRGQRRAGSAIDFFDVGTVDQAVNGVAHSGLLSGCQDFENTRHSKYAIGQR